MRSILRSLSGLILIFLTALAAAAQEREVRPVEFVKIADNLYQISGGRGANGGLYIGDEGVLVIDAKMDETSVSQVLEGIRKLTDEPVRFLVNTHSDGDHVMGNRFFPRDVMIVSHENCRREFYHARRDGTPSAWESPELAPFVPCVTYRDRMDLWLGSRKVELHYFGVGHTTGDTVVYIPEAEAAFLGDQIFQGRPQLIHSYKGGNSFEHVKTLRKMLETIGADNFLSGHADMIDRATIEKHIRAMVERQEKVRRMKAAGTGLDEIKAAFPENEARLIESIYNELK